MASCDDDVGRIIEDRYTLERHLGSGAHGNVWVANDRILGQAVALKWMRFDHGSMLARIRREITTLRLLRFPGVVRLIDEGIADGRPFLVMELVDGRPFPGVENDCRATWQTIAGPTFALLETLSHVHAAGVVHRDLKPDNVLVCPDGRTIMFDFSVSLLHAPHSDRLTGTGQIVGTPLYLAPEQILAKPADARTDLYAIGVMLHEALTGRAPHDATDMVAIVSKRLAGPVPPIHALDPTLPVAVASVIDRLLAIRPEDRFSSAAEVLAALRGESRTISMALPLLDSTAASAREVAPLDERALMQLFAGPDRLFHLREDAARVLFERTNGVASRVESELVQWVRLGLARRDGDVFVVDRASLDRLAAGLAAAPVEPRLRELLAVGLVDEAVRQTVEIAHQYAKSGDLGAATTALAEGLRAARAEVQGMEERRILSMWTKVALAEATPRALDGALYELARSRHSNADMARLQSLLRAALAAPGASGLHALEMADDIGPFTDPYLERARQRIRVAAIAARASSSLLAEVLEEIDEWVETSGDSMAELSAAEGHARHKYHEGRFDEAAMLYARAAALEPWTTGRIEAMLRSASALLEAFEHERAEKTADEARLLALQLRHPYWEGRAEWLLRSARYRMGKAQGPDIELVEAVARVGAQDLEALVCLNEATMAKRTDTRDVACTLAERAATIWRDMGRPFAAMLARALAIACGAIATATEVEALAARAISCKGTGIGIQTLGLLGGVFPDMRDSWQHAIAGLVGGIPRENWDHRMDVLSVNESLVGATRAGSGWAA